MSPTDTVLITERFIRTVGERLSAGKRVRRTLPVWGRLAVDHPVPFLCLYRRPSRKPDHATFRLVTSEAAYLTCSAERRQHEGLGRLTTAVLGTMADRFGGALLLEVWAGSPPDRPGAVTTEVARPGFRIFAPRENGSETLTRSFEEALRGISVGGKTATVAIVEGARRWPRGMSPLLSSEEAERIGCTVYGLEVRPVFLDPESGDPFPRISNELRRSLSVSLRRFFFDYARTSTTAAPQHFHVLGRRAMVKAVRDVDAMLARASESYEFLLHLTPTNTEQAWNQFKRHGFQRMPTLHYRPLLVDPVVLKRRLFKAPVERIEDPALALVYRQKLYEIDRQITMLQDRNSSRFLHESVQLYGEVDDELFGLATELLDRIPPRSRESPSTGDVDAEGFARRAREEIDFLRSQNPEVKARVEIRPDVAGLMVSRGNVLMSPRTRVPSSRVEALIQHEVGTHVLTYHNGRAQTLRILCSGLTGYDALQEGLAVLAEHLVGGLSRPRLRLLAGRVIAVRGLVDGSSFIETFRQLQRDFGFPNRTAFTVAVRTHRSGGLTKDAVYLLGLKQILDYIGAGGELEPLFVGKIAAEHIGIVRELTWRGVLTPPPLIPRYMRQADSLARLARLRTGVRVPDLIKKGRQ